MKARAAALVAIDFETTGSVADLPVEPWQIGLVRLRDGAVTDDCFDSLLCIEPGRPFNARVPGRHHELRDALADAPTMGRLWPDLRAWVSGVPLVAHNAATEKKHLRETAPIHRFGPWIDTLKLARVAYPNLEAHGLEFLVDRLDLRAEVTRRCPGRGAHDALYDAVACGALLQHLLGLDGWGDLTVQQLTEARPSAFYRRSR